MTNKFDRIHTNTNKKYIIRNCPCYNNERFIEDYLEDGDNYCPYKDIKCQDCADCVVKQIVELCEQYKKDYNTTNGVWLLANNITNLLDIQEVE